jgi:hypothetical protein
MQTKMPTSVSVDEVTRWRGRHLAATGFAPGLAAAIACDPHYDLHALIELVDRGCRPDLAAHILAPLDQEGEA